MVSVTATNRRWGKIADGTRTQIVIYLTNRWKVRIKQEGIYNLRIPFWKQGEDLGTGARQAVLKKESSLINLAHFCASILNTMTNDCPFIKV